MNRFKGYSKDEVYRVDWRVTATGEASATESMTLAKALAWQQQGERDEGMVYWLEQYNGYEWERRSITSDGEDETC